MRADETDVRLRERLIDGDDDALAEVYDRCSAIVYSAAVRITGDHGAAEDITQEVFVHLWEHPESYDPERAGLRTWLCVVTRSRALDLLRRNKTRSRHHAAAAMPEEQADIADAVLEHTEAKVVREAVQGLPAAQREAIQLAYYQHHTYREVARELNIPEGTAKSRLRVGLAALADRLAAEGIIER